MDKDSKRMISCEKCKYQDDNPINFLDISCKRKNIIVCLNCWEIYAYHTPRCMNYNYYKFLKRSEETKEN